MVEAVEDFFLNDLHKRYQIHDHSGLGINHAVDGHLKFIIMPMAMDIITFAKDLSILFVGEVWAGVNGVQR